MRRDQDRRHLRYESDLTDGEWQSVADLLPPPRRGGRPRVVNMREVANAILYFLSGQGGWDRLPKDFPPKSTVYDYYAAWRSDRTLSRLWIAICEDAP